MRYNGIFVIETGTWEGGSPGSARTGRGAFVVEEIRTFYRGSSTDLDIVSNIVHLVKGRKTVITLDSNHTMAQVLKELNAYAPLVRVGSSW